MLENAYILDKLLQAVTLSLVAYILIEQNMAYFLVLLLASFITLVVLDALQGKTGYSAISFSKLGEIANSVAKPTVATVVANKNKVSNKQPLKLKIEGGSLDQTRLYLGAPIPDEWVGGNAVCPSMRANYVTDYQLYPDRKERLPRGRSSNLEMNNNRTFSAAPYCGESPIDIIKAADPIHADPLGQTCLSDCQPCGLSSLPSEFKVPLRDRIIYGDNYRECGEVVTRKVVNNPVESPVLNLAKSSYLPQYPCAPCLPCSPRFMN